MGLHIPFFPRLWTLISASSLFKSCAGVRFFSELGTVLLGRDQAKHPTAASFEGFWDVHLIMGFGPWRYGKTAK